MTAVVPRPAAGSDQSERARLDQLMSLSIEPETRTRLWSSVDEILAHGDAREKSVTGLVLGYVQSGKTTAMTALMAGAADAGYRLIIAFLGSTNILLDQNTKRIYRSLGVEERTDYRWAPMRNPGGTTGTRELRDWLAKGRTVLITMLKHAGRIDALTTAIERAAADGPVLIVDDEADQASLNTKGSTDEESRTYAALRRLRESLPPHLYVQYTATPYAPLLLEPRDTMLPTFVSFLHPGPGYTGGREFFVDHAARVIRSIPTLDEQAPKRLPNELPKSLVSALANYLVGAATLLEANLANAPISMMVHSTQRNDVQARYFFLLERLIKKWRSVAEHATSFGELPAEIVAEREALEQVGARQLDPDALLPRVRYVLGETKAWLINSASAIRKVDWNLSPCHLLVGGNKLDRGFTVEGLTVTYMNRPTTVQIDTLEQRARAFGYRGDLLPYCQFFATPRTLSVLRGIVFTEYDLRAQLQDWLAEGRPVDQWANQVGLMLPSGTRPTRENVLTAMNTFNKTTHWHSLRRPSLDESARAENLALLQALGVLSFPAIDHGRLTHPTGELFLHQVVEALLRRWRLSASYSPDWRHSDILAFLERVADSEQKVTVMVLEGEGREPRIRDWDPQTGFVNLFQGADVRPVPGKGFYPGDRRILRLKENPAQIVLQVHHVRPRPMPTVRDLYTLAIHLGDVTNVRRGTPDA
jgi:Z1 domain-containing protein